MNIEVLANRHTKSGGVGTQEELAAAFGRHVNSVQRYVSDFGREGMLGLLSERSGPKGSWKVTPELRVEETPVESGEIYDLSTSVRL